MPNSMTTINLITFSDVMGKLAIGGDLTIKGGGYATGLNSSFNGTPTMQVGGDMEANFGGQLFFGDLYVGGTLTNNSGTFNAKNGSIFTNMAIPFDFASAENDLNTKSFILGTASTTANTSAQLNTSGELEFTGLATDLNVFNISASLLESANGIRFDLPNSAHALINVTGTGSGNAINITGGQQFLQGTSETRILYNFVDAEEIFMQNLTWEGSILVTNATYRGRNGEFHGQLIAQELLEFDNSNTIQFHNFLFEDFANPIPGVVPEPQTIGIITFLALFLFHGAHRWIRERHSR